MPRSERHRDRLLQGPGAVYTIATAAALLPVSDQEARVWLREQGLIRELSGRCVVIWSEVLDALRDGGPDSPQPVSIRTAPRRIKLDPL